LFTVQNPAFLRQSDAAHVSLEHSLAKAMAVAGGTGFAGTIVAYCVIKNAFNKATTKEKKYKLKLHLDRIQKALVGLGLGTLVGAIGAHMTLNKELAIDSKNDNQNDNKSDVLPLGSSANIDSQKSSAAIKIQAAERGGQARNRLAIQKEVVTKSLAIVGGVEQPCVPQPSEGFVDDNLDFGSEPVANDASNR
jgi:hypothetical protein